MGGALDEANRAAWQSRIATFRQNMFCWTRSIAQNIALGIPARTSTDTGCRSGLAWRNSNEFIRTSPRWLRP